MRKLIIALSTLGGIGLFSAPGVTAMPVDNTGIVDALSADSMIEDVRLYCHRGRVFLHWGACRSYRPRYYSRYYRYRRYY